MQAIEKTRTAKDILFVLFSHIVSIGCGALTSLVVPKILGVNDYGFYKTFTLYLGYTGLFHFGFADGIQLIYAGVEENELDKKLFLTFSHFLILGELVISLIGVLISFFFVQGDLKFIFVCVSIGCFIANVMCYFQYILQCTRRFKEYSLKSIVTSILMSLGVATLWIIYHFCGMDHISFKIYVSIYLSVNLLMTAWFLVRYRGIVFGKGAGLAASWPHILRCFRYGFPLLIANLCSGLILSFDTQFVNIFFENEIYAVYAFAYTILALVTQMISAVTVVIYPVLRKSTKDELRDEFPKLMRLLTVFIAASLLVFYLMIPIINWLLPKYTGSLTIFRIILPGLMFSSVVSVIIQNYYKALGRPGAFFVISAVTLGVSIGLNFLAYYLFGTTESISWASVVTLVFYYIVSILPLIVKMKVKWVRSSLYMLFCVSAFFGCMLIKTNWLSFLVYLLSYFLFTSMFYGKDILISAKKKLMRIKESDYS